MKQPLWTVFAGEEPLAVVAATRQGEAWRMIAALANHDDLPSERWSEIVIRLCSPEQTARLRKRANKLGIADSFQAFLQNGTFLTYIGGVEGGGRRQDIGVGGMRRVGSVSLGILATAALIVLLAVQFFHVSRNGTEMAKGVSQPHFTLTGTDGKTVSEADFRGKYLIVYFGYIFCPDVCPTNLSSIAEGLDKLGAKAGNVVPIFISVDPARDTPDKLKDYVAQFSPRMIGLSGSAEQLRKAAEQFGVFYARGEGGDENYSVDHSAFTYLVGPDGVRLDTLAHGFPPERLVNLLSQKIGNPVSP